MNATQPTTSTTPESPEPAGMTKARTGEAMTGAEERGALDFLLGSTAPLEYDVPVKLETPDGLLSITFHVRQQDPGVLDSIEAAHRSGDGPFSRLDVPAFNAEACAKATVYLEDATGKRTFIDSEEFIGGHPMGKIGAMGLRFKFQGGLLDGVVSRIREVSGYANDRVGTAQRTLVEAGKGS